MLDCRRRLRRLLLLSRLLRDSSVVASSPKQLRRVEFPGSNELAPLEPLCVCSTTGGGTPWLILSIYTHKTTQRVSHGAGHAGRDAASGRAGESAGVPSWLEMLRPFRSIDRVRVRPCDS